MKQEKGSQLFASLAVGDARICAGAAGQAQLKAIIERIKQAIESRVASFMPCRLKRLAQFKISRGVGHTDLSE
jgi:hypothetical protein